MKQNQKELQQQLQYYLMIQITQGEDQEQSHYFFHT